MSEKVNPWFPPVPASVLLPPATAGTASFGSGNGKSSLLLCSSSGPAPEKVKESLFHTRSADFKSTLDVTVHNSFTGFTVLPPKNSSNYPSNYTPSKSNHSPGHNPTIKLPQLNPNLSTSKPNQSSSSQPATPSSKPASPPISYAEKAKPIADKTLRRVAPLSYSENGVPQVTIPDEVFQRGAELHKDFVLGSFLAKMPSYQAIQSVLNFMWGKGQKLDIRTNKEKRTIMVRIPNEYIRKKVLEKRIWYVGTAMFQVTPWSSRGSVSAVDIGSIPLWAHLNGLPLDLRTLEGLSFVAGLIGEPKETDEFTKNISDVNIAHVKVEADMTKPLPTLIELRRTSGEIIPVHVEYPWTPPVCSFCKQIGHISKDCLTATHVWVEKKTDLQPPSSDEATPETNMPAQQKPDTQMTDAPYPETETDDFEADLQEIMSTPHSSASESRLIEIRPISSGANPFSSLAIIPSSQAPFSPPRDLLPPITFSSSSKNSHFVVALAANPIQTRRSSPFKHKVTKKRPSPPSHLSITLKNAFSTLDSSLLDPPPPILSPAPVSDPPDSWLASSKVHFGALLETHIKAPQLNHVLSKTSNGWNHFSNHASDHDGRIILIWKPHLTVNILHQSRQSITCEVTIAPLQQFVLTACYAANTSEERSDLWADLINVQQTYSLDSSFWIVGGDFNQITHYSEHSLPSVNCFDLHMTQFRDTLSHLSLFDLRFTGPLFTWSNKCPSYPIAKKLDRILINQSWIATFPHSQAFFLAPEISDHSPSVVDLAVDLPTPGTKPFKFFNYLTKHPLFFQTVLQAWDQSGGMAWDLSHLCAGAGVI
ncbi:hypothetical protein IGI04_018155 [Brassica rapa subsp. trilocularis]|uniref:CCHC-type domain-containing protein n=1 Tax=Brassica rapa subsp. trilocularis TaxID=1813537 RepID=A0ABQ7MEH6_BRACM|nr:hypothetical protein IGI04_018155 [Brassica rapa subsp. trilocularis]